MTSQINRLDDGGRIDRSRPIFFYYDGNRYQGYQGDTLASALIANAVKVVGRSFKYHRPRGIFSAGPEEPNALVQLEEGGYTDPNTRATMIELYEGLVASSQNAWPSVNFDINEINNIFKHLIPAGFYYKTFMWPPKLWMWYERRIRKAAGLGCCPVEIDPDKYEIVHAHCDVLVVGAGPSGLAAAVAAGRTGARVILVDEQAELGGSLLNETEEVDGKPASEWVREIVGELATMREVRILSRTTLSGYFDYNWLTALERVTDHLGPGGGDNLPRQRFWKLRAVQVVLSTGAIERPLVFAENDRPGIMLAGAVRTYINRYGVLPGKKILIFTNNDTAYRTAIAAVNAGSKVSVVDVRNNPNSLLVQDVRSLGVEIYSNTVITDVVGRKGVKSVEVMELNNDGSDVSGIPLLIDCDCVAMSGGWNPSVHLWSQARGKLRWNEQQSVFEPDISTMSPINSNRSVGCCNSISDLYTCLHEGFSAGIDAAMDAGFSDSQSRILPKVLPVLEEPIRPMWDVPSRGHKKKFHEFQNDSTSADLELATREGMLSVEHTKRYTTTGMGTDQGKTSNVNGIAIMARAQGISIPEVGTTTFRPPYTPVTFGAITGQNRRELFEQVRTTAMHTWHVENKAVFEDVGDWKRPRYFPQGEEDMRAAVQRECMAARKHVGILDASTLGKIDIQGPDAANLLEMVYTNAWQKLEAGRCRYGVMLNEHGMIFDDGVTTCLDKNHYHMTTTTGGASRVMGWLEEWLQTEWPSMQVYCTSVTEQWAVASISGPNARDLLCELTTMDLSAEALPFMSVAEGTLAGVPARIFRISFTGESAFEINVPARYGLHLWKVLMKLGLEYDICPYGTEAMHVLRAEKGFIIVGQDTDGTCTPMDVGMDWIVSKKKKDFIGKRSFYRSDILRGGRKQLVGLLPENSHFVLPEGAHLMDGELRPPTKAIGHVTSSYMSPNLGCSFALALIENGMNRHGEIVNVALMDGTSERAKITDTVFLDKDGERSRA